MSLAARIGSLHAIHRYPVKSMLGERIDAGMLAPRGLIGDRTHALLDVASGRIASAKKPAMWRELLQCAARCDSDAARVEIRLPSGEVLTPDDAASDARLSEFLQREVRLVSQVPEAAEIERSEPDEVLAKGVGNAVSSIFFQLGQAAPRDTFVDFAPLHVIASSTLAELSRVAGQEIEAIRYRPNLIVDAPGLAPFEENHWIGRTMRIGTDVELEFLMPTPRCAVPTLRHGDLPLRPDALRTVTLLNRVELQAGTKLPCVGAHARVVRGGAVRCGDAVAL